MYNDKEWDALAYLVGLHELRYLGDLRAPWEEYLEPLDPIPLISAHGSSLKSWCRRLLNREFRLSEFEEEGTRWIGIVALVSGWIAANQQIPFRSHPEIPSAGAMLVFECLGRVRTSSPTLRHEAINWLRHYLPEFETMDEANAEGYVDAVSIFTDAGNIDLLQSMYASLPSSLSEGYRKAIESKLAEFASDS